MISVSLNEIYSETYKALRSVKIDWSLAKDCANKAKWLAQHDQYFLGSILKTADLYKNNKISISINKNTKKKTISYSFSRITSCRICFCKQDNLGGLYR